MRRSSTNPELNKMTYRAPLFLGLAMITMFGCLQKLDQGADDGTTNISVDPNGGLGAPFPIDTKTPVIGIVADDSGEPTQTSTDPCDKLKADAVQIRTTFCSKCHQDKGITPMDDVENDASLINHDASSAYPGWKYVVPGDLTKSLLYDRIVVKGSMPPPTTIDAPVLQPSISDMSVIRDWILCMGASSAP